MRTGILDITNAEHHADPAVGSSGLKLMQRSPLHYWAAYRDPARQRREATPAMKIGTAWHAAIFEPDAFAADYVRIPEGLDRRTKEGKALFAEIEGRNQEPLGAADFDRIMAMRDSAAAHPVSRVIFGLPDGAAEKSMFATDPGTGVHVKIRPDYMVLPCAQFPSGLLVDGKTGEDMSPEGFAKYAWNWELHLQAAFYCDVFQIVMRTDQRPAFVWAAQEKDAPYATAYYSAADDFLDYGRRLYRPLLARLGECERTDKWPGYAQLVQPVVLPAWAAKQVAESA